VCIAKQYLVIWCFKEYFWFIFKALLNNSYITFRFDPIELFKRWDWEFDYHISFWRIQWNQTFLYKLLYFLKLFFLVYLNLFLYFALSLVFLHCYSIINWLIDLLIDHWLSDNNLHHHAIGYEFDYYVIASLSWTLPTKRVYLQR
jgi:hypothetical protein